MATKIQLRRDTAANWTAANPALAQGEAGYESDTGKLKIGDGTKTWATLSYVSGGGSAASETVAGIVELATAAETTAGTDATRAVHPAGLKVELDKKAPLDSPALAGTPTAPTAAAGTNTTQLATTAFVAAAAPDASTTAKGLVQLADAAAITAGTAGRAVDAAQLKAVSDADDWTRTGTVLSPATAGDAVDVDFPLGTAALPGLTPVGDPNTGVWAPAADTLALSTNGTEKVRVTPTGFVGVGTSAPDIFSRGHAQIVGISSASGNSYVQINGASGSQGGLELGVGAVRYGGIAAHAASVDIGSTAAVPVNLYTNNINRIIVDSSGRVGIGIGAVAVSNRLEVGGEPEPRIGINSSGAGTTTTAGVLFQSASATYGSIVENITTGELSIKSGASGRNAFFITFGTNDGSEKARLTSSGQLLVGTSTSVGGESIQISNGTTDNTLGLYNSSSSIAGAGTTINFRTDGGATGRNQASIAGLQETVYASGGRLVFSTTADGASSPTERMRIKASGVLNIAATTVYADNTAAKAGGLVAGDIYRKADGTLMITF